MSIVLRWETFVCFQGFVVYWVFKEFLTNVALAEKLWLEYSQDLDMQNQFN